MDRGRPSLHRSPGAVGHQVQQPAALQVHEPRDPLGGRVTGRLEEVGLVQAERDHTRVGVLADPPTGLGPARSVSTARGPIAATRSVQVRTLQAGSRQRQMRLRQTSTTGRPPIGRSRTHTRRRPWASAHTPQPTQPTTGTFVCTSSCHSPPPTRAARTSTPSRPSSADPDGLRC
jgi:hypothetical protein